MGTLSCSPGLARLRTAEGSISVDSLDGNACLSSQATAADAQLVVHAQDNLESLSVSSSCATKLILSPELAKKVHCSTQPDSLAAALPEGVKLQGSQDSHALSRCNAKCAGEQASHRIPDQECLPSIHIRCSGKLNSEVESWIASLTRRRQARTPIE